MGSLAQYRQSLRHGGFAKGVVERCQRYLSSHGEIEIGRVVARQPVLSAQWQEVFEGSSGRFVVALDVESQQEIRELIGILSRDPIAFLTHGQDVGYFQKPMGRN